MYTHSSWLIIREMQIKIRRRYHFCHNFGKNIKSQIWAPSRTAGGVEIWYNHITEQFSTSNKVNDACTLQSGNFTEVENLAACYIHLFHWVINHCPTRNSCTCALENKFKNIHSINVLEQQKKKKKENDINVYQQK